MAYLWVLVVVLGMTLAGCGKKEPPATAPAAISAPSVADEAAVMKDAQKRRERFQGDGKAEYTPQDVRGF